MYNYPLSLLSLTHLPCFQFPQLPNLATPILPEQITLLLPLSLPPSRTTRIPSRWLFLRFILPQEDIGTVRQAQLHRPPVREIPILGVELRSLVKLRILLPPGHPTPLLCPPLPKKTIDLPDHHPLVLIQDTHPSTSSSLLHPNRPRRNRCLHRYYYYRIGVGIYTPIITTTTAPLRTIWLLPIAMTRAV